MTAADAPRAGRRFWVRRILRLGIWLGACGTTVFLLALAFVYARFPGVSHFPADCAIVFGTAVRPTYNAEGQIVYTGPGPGILRRVGTAAELYRAGKVGKVFLSGGKGEGMVESEASVMKRIAIAGGIRMEDIVIEEESRSTDENLLNTLPLMGDCTSIVGVSDRYHLARIELLSWFDGRRIQTFPAFPPADQLFENRSVIREVFGIMFIGLSLPWRKY